MKTRRQTPVDSGLHGFKHIVYVVATRTPSAYGWNEKSVDITATSPPCLNAVG